MPTYFARKAGNINASDVWATTPSGTAAAVTFVAGDVLMANSFAITVNVSTNLGTGQVRNDTTGGAATGGSFSLSNGVTLTANVYAGTSQCVTLAANATANLVGDLIAGGVNGRPVQVSVAGTLNVTATNITAASANAIYVDAFACNLNVTASGLITGGTATNMPAIRYDGSGTVSITGNCIGGTAAGAQAINHNTNASLTITGNVTGGSNSTAYGLNNVLGANINITGQCIGGVAAAGAFNTTTGSITATRAVGNGFGPGSVGLTAAPGIANSALGVVTIEQLEYGSLGQSPTTGTGIRLKKANTNVAVFNYCDTAGAKTLIDATQNAAMPAASNVRSGVSYASGALTGSCAVPAAGSVSLGVPVDAGFGTAVLTPAAIRAELATELGRIDTTISSRLSPSGTLATVTTLTNAPTVPTAAEIAAAVEGSLLNEADGQAVLNAIVAAIGNQNLSEVSLVAAVRADLERTGGKLDSIPTTAAPTAAENASAVWGASAKVITGGVVDTLTNAPASVTPSDIWSHSARTLTSASGPTATEIRQEMDSNSTKLANLDASVSSRLAGSAYTAPSTPPTAIQIRQELDANSTKLDVAVSSRLAASEASKLDAVKAKTDALIPERLANVATTAIVGNLISQANS
jgi:hypothetical protein